MAQLQASTVAGILTTTGDVGIGTATPQSGGGASKWVTLEGGASYSGGIIYSQQGAVKAYHYTQDNLLHHQGASGVGHIWLTSNNEKMRLTDGGNVGIGTTAPVSLVHASNGNYRVSNETAATFRGYVFGATAGDSAEYSYLKWEPQGGELRLWNNPAAFGGFFSIYTNAVERLRITAAGNVGIGTNNPTNRLTVYQGGGVRVNGIVSGDWIEMSGNLPGYSANQYPVIKSNGTIHFANNNKYSAYLEGANTYFGILDSTTTTRVFLATSGNTYFTGGNVGIGTVTPRKELDVQGNNLCVVAGQLILGEDAYLTSADYIGLKTSFQSGTNDYMILSGKSDGATYVSAKAGSSVFIRSGGNTSAAQIEVTDTYARTYSNLGVGTAPSQALDVAGNIRSSNVIYWNGITGALSWDTGVVTMETNSATAISLKTNGTNRIYITSGGNVGIGTVSPSSILQLADGPAIATNAAYQSFQAGGFGVLFRNAYDAYITFNTTYSPSGWVNKYSSYKSGVISLVDGAFTVDLGTGTTAGSDSGLSQKFIITNGGNVGIGTTNPAIKLHVVGTNGAIQIGGSGYTLNPSGMQLGQYVASMGYIQAPSGGRVEIWNGATENIVTFNNDKSSQFFGSVTATSFTGDIYTNSIYKQTNGSPIVINAGLNSSKALRVFYDMDVYNTVVFTDASWNSQGSVGGTSGIMYYSANTAHTFNNNVGIGTATPLTKLHIGNNVSGGGFSTFGSYQIILYNTGNATDSYGIGIEGGTMMFNSDDTYAFYVDNSKRMVIQGSNVGIGLTNPDTKLNVLVGAGGANGTAGLRIGGTANYASLELGIEGNYDGQIRTYGNDLHLYAGHWRTVGLTATEDHAIRFFTSKTSSTNWSTAKMILTADGSVGIGSASPSRKLDVVGNARIGDNTSQQAHAALQVSAGQGSVTTYRDIDMCGSWAAGEGHAITANYSTGVDNIVGQIVFQHDSPGSRIKFGRIYDSGNQSTYPMNLVSNGSGANLGIGTDSPARRLDVREGNVQIVANFQSTSTTSSRIKFTDANTGAENVNIGATGTSLAMWTNNTVRMTILSGGNVGIGTTNPGAKLQVAGTVATDSALADVDAYRIIKPNGGVRVTANSSETGAIKITYPVSYTNTMHRVKLNIYEYTTNESFTIYFGGYNYSPSSEWYNEFAYILNNPGVDRNFTVRFGHDGSRMVVYIGELASGWTYPQIFIEEVELGYSGQSSTWRDGAWAIGFEASAFQNITRTISNPQATNWARNGSSVYFENGNVGIGTVTPTHKLHVNGTLRVDSTTSFGTEYGAVPSAIIGNTQDEKCLGTPDEWLAINVSGTDYAVPLFSLG